MLLGNAIDLHLYRSYTNAASLGVIRFSCSRIHGLFVLYNVKDHVTARGASYCTVLHGILWLVYVNVCMNVCVCFACMCML